MTDVTFDTATIDIGVPEDVELSQADRDRIGYGAAALQSVVNTFNHQLRSWEIAHQMGANFRFRYDAETGKKELTISDVSPARTDRPQKEDAEVRNAAKVIGDALSQVEKENKNESI